jgi:hypothetical protein
MRLLASLEHYISSTDGHGLQLHQYASGRFTGDADGAPAVVSVNTDYPRDGRIRLTVEQGPEQPWTLSLRIPEWCGRYTLRHGSGDPVTGAVAEEGWLRVERTWAPGDEVVLELDLTPRLVVADPRVDAVRGCAAIERGPLVYCLEQADHPGGGLDDVSIDPAVPLTLKDRPDLLGGVVTVLAGGYRSIPVPSASGWWPYRTRPEAQSGSAIEPAAEGGTAIELTAIPYYAWANRSSGAMRVWLPTD